MPKLSLRDLFAVVTTVAAPFCPVAGLLAMLWINDQVPPGLPPQQGVIIVAGIVFLGSVGVGVALLIVGISLIRRDQPTPSK